VKRLSLAERDRTVWLKMAAGRGRKRQLFILLDSSSSVAINKFFDSQVLTAQSQAIGTPHGPAEKVLRIFLQ